MGAASIKAIIREMDAEELEQYALQVKSKHCTDSNEIIDLIQSQYKQLTGTEIQFSNTQNLAS